MGEGRRLLFGALIVASLIGCTKQPVDGGKKILNLVVNTNIKGLDPASLSDRISGNATAQIFESLYGYHYLKRPLTLVPILAATMPVISKDRKTYRIPLKHGVFFHDDPAFPGGKGREMTAHDFVYSWKRVADPRNMSEAYYNIEGKIVGLTEWARGVKSGKTTYETEVPGLRAVDDHTVEIKLTKAFPQFPGIMALVPLAVVAQEAVKKYGAEIVNHPVGTGPFRLVRAEDWVRNSKLTLTKNPNYRNETYPTEGEADDTAKGLLADAGKRLPLVDYVVFNELIEDQPRWLNGVSGHLDIFDIPNDSFAAAVKDMKSLSPELAKKGISLDIVPELGLSFFGFNMKDPTIGKSKKLRQAFAYAINSKQYIEKFSNGRGLPAQSMIPPGIDTYDPSYQNPFRTFDLEKAKQLLAEAGYKDGKGLPELTYDAQNDTKGRQIAEFVRYALQAIGVKVKIVSATFPELLKKIYAGRGQIFQLGWGAAYADPQAFFMAFYGPNRPPGPNLAFYDNKQFDELYDRAIVMEPSKERTSLYRKMRDMVVDDAVWAFNSHRLNYRLIQPWVRNFKWRELGPDIYQYMNIDLEEKARRM